MEDLTTSLSSLSISSPLTISHSSAISPAEWNQAISTSDDVPANYSMTKTLVFKPKATGSAAADAPSALMVLAKAESDTNSAAIAKANGFKDMRLATPELLQQVTGATKDDVSPLSLSLDPSTPPSLLVVLDASLFSDDSTLYALRARSSSQTIFLTGNQIEQYLNKTGVKVVKSELKAAVAAPAKSSTPKPPTEPKDKSASRIADAELIGITVHKSGDFPEWYQQVLRKGDMLDYYDVSGCYILKPWSYFVWERIQAQFDAQIKEMGVSNCYFPMFVSEEVLQKEKDHIEGFAPEVAWVTKAGKHDLERPVAIRPTSETVMYPYYAKWIQSHRDLPLKLNQWNSVVRWEFKHPQPFLRTREFLWQEGHTAHLTLQEADVEVRQILELYRRVYSELLAVPVVPGVKSEKEKFAGGLYTTTVEGFVPTTGRGIQGGTSHCLGQNFSKMFNIYVDDPKASEEDRGTEKGRAFVWQNSWGLSTRTIGVMVMVHGDDKGLVMPPRVSQIQVAIVPTGIAGLSRDEKERLSDVCKETEVKLIKVGVRAKADLRENYTPGFKFSDWEMRGVPIRLEIGPKDLAKDSVLSVRRDTFVKKSLENKGLEERVKELLDQIHNDMFEKADKEYESRRKVVTEWKDFQVALDGKNHVIIPWCEIEECEDEIKDRSARTGADGEAVDERAPSMGAKSLCIPFEQDKYPDIKGLKCPQCGKDAKRWTMFGRSY